MSTCKSCGARVTWLETAAGKKLPVDEDPSARGNIAAVGGMAKVYSTPQDAEALNPGEPRFISHFATCPDAGKWRRDT